MTATTVDPGTHLDTIGHLDWTPVCAAPGCQSGRPPATHIVTQSCGCQILSCDPCTEGIRKFKAGHYRSADAECKSCGAHFHNCCSHELIVSIKPL